MKRFVISFLLIMTIIFNCPMGVYASSTVVRPESSTDITGFDDWPFLDKVEFYWDNLSTVVYNMTGLVINALNGSGWDNETFKNILYTFDANRFIADDCESFNEFAAKHMGLDTDGNLVFDDELVDYTYDCVVHYIEEYTGWYVLNTYDYKNYPASNFNTQTHYDTFIAYCNNNLKGTDLFLLNGTMSVKSVYDDVQQSWINKDYIYVTQPTDYLFLYSSTLNDGSINVMPVIDWQTIRPDTYRLYETGIDLEDVVSGATYYNLTNSLYPTGLATIFTDGIRQIRVYKTLEDLKAYSVGQRPYYVTEKFVNYDSTVDNSTTITQTEIDNSITYGDIITYITNNYENSDGLTEDELRAILEEYLSQIGGGSGSGSGSGSGDDDDDDGGGGLLDFLSGLGSLGDAILSIIGKLIEYVGKAIDLIVNGISGIIEKIPQSITGLMTAAFPFLPEEFFTAIELALILGVVCIVIKIFK